MKTRRGWLILITILVACGLVVALSDWKSRESKVHVFNWTDYIGTTTIQSFERLTSMHVTYDNYGSNEELIAKLEGGGADYDVIFPSGYAAEILIRKDLLHKINRANIPNEKFALSSFAKPSFDRVLDYCMPYTLSLTGIGYDSGIVTDQEAGSLAVLFSGKFAGKILMLDDMRASLGIALKSLGFSANSTQEAEIKAAADRLVRQKPGVHVYTSSNIPQLLASGEVSLAYGWSGDILQAAASNPKIHFVAPREGSLLYVDFVCVPSAGKNRAGGEAFINHIFNPQVSAEIAEAVHYATANSGAEAIVSAGTKSLWKVVGWARTNEKFEGVNNIGGGIEIYDREWKRVKGE